MNLKWILVGGISCFNLKSSVLETWPCGLIKLKYRGFQPTSGNVFTFLSGIQLSSSYFTYAEFLLMQKNIEPDYNPIRW